MTINEIITFARGQLDDTIEPYRWSDDELALYLNNTVNELCRESRVLKDATSAITQIPVVADTQSYVIDKSIVSIVRVRLTLGIKNLIGIDESVADDFVTNWETSTGTPRYYIHDSDISQQAIKLIPTPIVDDTLNLVVYRLPLTIVSMAVAADELEIPAEYHGKLFVGMYKQAYDKHDSDTYDPRMRDRYFLEWEAIKDKINRQRMNEYTTRRRIVPHFGAI